MSISARSRATQAPPLAEARAADVEVTEDLLRVWLTDGREIGVPLAWFPRLLAATPRQRGVWEMIGDGSGIHWPEIDEDLAVAGFLGQDEQRASHSDANVKIVSTLVGAVERRDESDVTVRVLNLPSPWGEAKVVLKAIENRDVSERSTSVE